MRVPIFVLLLASLSATGCARLADSQINPMNWFERAKSTPTVDAEGNIAALVPNGALIQAVDSRALAPAITALSINRSPDGAIVVATGESAVQGYYNVELVPISQEGGTLTLALRASAPVAPTSGAQELTAAYVLDNAELTTIRRITVQGQSNTMTARR